MAGQLKERYLIPEVMQKPDRAEEQVFYQILKMSEKSMLERIGEVERERGEYRAYIEQWVHEVKTPITALKLLCENNRSPFPEMSWQNWRTSTATRNRRSTTLVASIRKKTTLSGK